MRSTSSVPAAVIFAIALGTGALPAHAQSTRESETIITQADNRINDSAAVVPILLSAGPAWLGVTGFDTPAPSTLSSGGSMAMVHQEGEGNTIMLSQLGFANRAVLTQVGSFNRIDARQEGDRNLLEVLLQGSNNGLDVTQRGNDNVYKLDFLGDGLAHSVLQEGSGLQAAQIGIGTLPLSIEQRGTGMELVIHHSGPGGAR